MTYPYSDCCPNQPFTNGCDDGWCCTHETRREEPAAPCGRRDPTCARPESCDECLPRDRRHLHDRILTRCDPAWYGMADNPIRLFAAMRAVVEVCREHQAEGVDGRPTTVELIDPSVLLDAIARELGIKEAS